MGQLFSRFMIRFLSIIFTIACLAACGPEMNSLEVTATAYTSRPSETDGDPTTAAWGNKLEPGVKEIAVSRDLLRLGLRNGTKVRIKGLPGHYVVMDKMAARWSRRIDVYFGNDVKGARKWGSRRVEIFWKKDKAQKEQEKKREQKKK